MTELKVGDKVKAKEGWYIGYTLNSRYNLPRTPGIVVESGDYVIIDYDGKLSPPVNPDGFDLISTHIPLYSEEQAVSFLREKGYEVKEPPKTLSGSFTIYKHKKTGNIHGFSSHELERHEWSSSDYDIIAISSWIEGEGL